MAIYSDADLLRLFDIIAGRKVNRPNAQSLIIGLRAFSGAGLAPSILEQQVFPHFLAQVTHESMDFTYDREVWGPTAAQKRYDTRTDLGNTPEVDGDGKANMGMGPIQLTGAANRRYFYDWCKMMGWNPPDFVGNDNLLTDPWEGLSAVWFWEDGKRGYSLSRYARENNIEAITRKINGGLNGYEDRVRRYTAAALAMLGYSNDKQGITNFQKAAGFTGRDVDGIAGQKTRAALHAALTRKQEKEGPITLVLGPEPALPVQPPAVMAPRLPISDGSYLELTPEVIAQLKAALA